LCETRNFENNAHSRARMGFFIRDLVFFGEDINVELVTGKNFLLG